MRGIPLGADRATFEAFEERVERSALYAHLDYPEDEEESCCCEASPPEFGGLLPDADCAYHGERLRL